MKLSVVIPVRGEEPALAALVARLCEEFSGFAFAVVVATTAKTNITLPNRPELRIQISSHSSRSALLNCGMSVACSEWVWLLHADSVVTPALASKVRSLITTPPDQAIYYAWLKFESDGPRLTVCNSWFANIRSYIWQCPFGDQGFLLDQKTLQKVGNFPLEFDSGEDHAWIQRAKQLGVKIFPLNAMIKTSARKYQEQGWFYTTAQHLKLTLKQWRSQRGVTSHGM